RPHQERSHRRVHTRVQFGAVTVDWRNLGQVTIAPFAASQPDDAIVHFVVDGYVIGEHKGEAVHLGYGDAVLVADPADHQVRALSRSTIVSLRASSEIVQAARIHPSEVMIAMPSGVNPLIAPLSA